MFQSGLSLGDVLRALESETEKIAAAASIEKLLSLGAPFFSQEASADCFRNPTKWESDER